MKINEDTIFRAVGITEDIGFPNAHARMDEVPQNPGTFIILLTGTVHVHDVWVPGTRIGKRLLPLLGTRSTHENRNPCGFKRCQSRASTAKSKNRRGKTGMMIAECKVHRGTLGPASCER